MKTRKRKWLKLIETSPGFRSTVSYTGRVMSDHTSHCDCVFTDHSGSDLSQGLFWRKPGMHIYLYTGLILSRAPVQTDSLILMLLAHSDAENSPIPRSLAKAQKSGSVDRSWPSETHSITKRNMSQKTSVTDQVIKYTQYNQFVLNIVFWLAS